ncbi:MAG: phosphoribosyltransferase [Candidatus Babeliales bacterium]
MFQDRYDAANQLALALKQYQNNPDVIILAIPRGGLELGFVLAEQLKAPLDVVFAKKIGAPNNPEYAIGALTLHEQEIDPRFMDVSMQDYIDQETERIRTLLKKRYQEYRGQKLALDLHNKIVIVVDDGVATGRTVKLALKEVKQFKPKKLILAVPVGAPDTIKELEKYADEVVCLQKAELFFAVGQFYDQFPQVDDQEAIRLLHKAND